MYTNKLTFWDLFNQAKFSWILDLTSSNACVNERVKIQQFIAFGGSLFTILSMEEILLAVVRLSHLANFQPLVFCGRLSKLATWVFFSSRVIIIGSEQLDTIHHEYNLFNNWLLLINVFLFISTLFCYIFLCCTVLFNSY